MNFKEFLKESDASTNVSGPDVQNPEKPLNGKDAKIVKRKEDDLTESAFDFGVDRLLGKKNFIVPHWEYERMKIGREKYRKWEEFTPNENLKNQISNALYVDGECYISSSDSGASALLRHKRNVRMKSHEELYMSESFDPKEQAILSFSSEGYETIYNSAYDYAMDELGYDDDKSQLFATLLIAWIDRYFDVENSEDEDAYEMMDSVIKIVDFDRQPDELVPSLNMDVADEVLGYIYKFLELDGFEENIF